MSDPVLNSTFEHKPAYLPWHKRRRDRGMSLPEVMIAVTVMGLVVGTLAMVTSVILRQLDNTEGRTNNARSEQNVSLWMPTDLSSAESVDTDPAAVPCGPTPACPPSAELGGSNALMLSWNGSLADSSTGGVATPTLTVVSYRVIEVAGEFRLIRVHCFGVSTAPPNPVFTVTPACDTAVVLRELEPPPPGFTWIPGVTAPSWVLTVSNALAADDISGPGDTVADPGLDSKNARRVVVTINGGGDAAGLGGGQNQISLSAGGTAREYNLTTDDLSGAPTFIASRSRCGGNFGMIVDKSGSISQTQMDSIKGGIRNFIDAFAGTPIKLEVVTFSATSTTLDSAGGWTRYYDMLIDSDVNELKGLVGDPADPSSGIQRGGGTNWEDGFFRMLRNTDGTVQSSLPGTLIFFTDGVPTRSRLDYSSATAPAVPDPLDNGLPGTDGGSFYQIGWNRAERIVRDRGQINLIGVYVSPNLTATSQWTNQGAGYHWVYEVGDTVVYEQGATTYERNANVVYQVQGSGMRFERWNGSSWVSAASGYSSSSSQARNAYLTANTSPNPPDPGDNYRARRTGSSSSWVAITQAQYEASNTGSGTGEGFRTTVSPSLSSTWVSATAAQYNGSNTTTDSSDGWRTSTSWVTTTQGVYEAGNVNSGTADGYRTTLSGTPSVWSAATQAQFDASNTTSDDLDGWRGVKAYSLPYTNYEATTTLSINNSATIGNIVVGNRSGVAGGYVEASPAGGPYTNADVADLFVLPDYTNFSAALTSIALGQCGGTVTLQTRVGAAAAQDPFTYQNSATDPPQVVTTSAAYRSGTFDVALPGGASQTITISPQDFTSLTAYTPVSWSCKSGGVAYPFTSTPIPGHEPWTSIELVVAPNKAVSCIQTVAFA
ncbi:MAG: prepilin-type N-terminal cleavage/methylation domain-containing protein [Actinomycetota bacterium]